MEIAIAPAVALIETEKVIEAKGEQATGGGILQDRPLAKNSAQAKRNEERSGEATPTEDKQ